LIQKIQRQFQHPLTLKLNNWLPSTHNRWLPKTEQMGKYAPFCIKPNPIGQSLVFWWWVVKKYLRQKVEEKIKPVYQSTTIRRRIDRSSVPKFLHRQKQVGAKVWRHAEQLYLKKGTLWEHLLILHTRRFYWPGSYALRGVIVQCMQAWGLPFFSSFIYQWTFWHEHWNLHKFVKLLKLKASHESKIEDFSFFFSVIFTFTKKHIIEVYEMFCLYMFFSLKTNCFAWMFDQIFWKVKQINLKKVT